MAKLTGNFSLLLVVLSHVCLSPLLIASAGAPRIARTPSAHKEHRRQRQLTDIVGRGATTRVHTSEDPSAPITYGGGPVMTGNPSINVYIIYYGSWPAGSGQKIIENFIRSLSADSQRQGSPADPKVKRWWAISAAYTQEEEDGTKTNVSSKCKEEWIPKPSPNGNPAIDFTLSTISHEIAEAATDPDVQTGWGDENGENADKCYMDVGQTKTGKDSRGGTYKYNLVGMNSMRFLIQSNWDWQKNKCVTQRKYQ
ncbi:unnamed protein product [Closterium sp. NIES-64]|nr:unnamed protein product [Closterium sp. NIES-64]